MFSICSGVSGSAVADGPETASRKAHVAIEKTELEKNRDKLPDHERVRAQAQERDDRDAPFRAGNHPGSRRFNVTTGNDWNGKNTKILIKIYYITNYVNC